MGFWDNFLLLFRFTVEGYVANYIFAFTLLRREKFTLRLTLSMGAVLCSLLLMAAACTVAPAGEIWPQVLCFAVILGPLNFAWLGFCFKDSPWNLIFCVVFGIMTKLGTVQLISAFRHMSEQSAFPELFQDSGAIGLISQYVAIIAIYIGIYFVVGRHYVRSDSFIRCGKRIVPLYLFTAIAMPVITSASGELSIENIVSAVLLDACAAIICFLVIQVQFSLSREMVSEGQKSTLDALLVESQKQFETLKESIEIINLKCHDMRHQLRALESGTINGAYLDELTSAISIYDSTIKTGNGVLDIILTDKSLRCTANKIDFTCIVEGEQLSFMSESDISSLFGNAIENAMEYEASIEDEEKRFISLIVRANADILFIRVENYWCGEPLEWNAGLPVSTKSQDRLSHGFGMLSMRRVVEKYGGELQAKTEDNLFQVIATIPLK